MSYSIVICTYNRCSLLDQTIDSILKVLKGRDDFEILIIDNNSKDNTAAIKEKYAPIPEVLYYLETNQGLSHARNRGLREASKEIVVYLDDDIDIADDYFDLNDMFFADKQVNICGGKVLPYKVNIPDWLPEKYFYLVSVFDMGDEDSIVTYIMGGNFSIRREVALKIGGYNTALGRSGTNLMSGEENEYQDRAKKLGYLIEYKPKLTIFHKIEAKLNKEYVLKYAYEQGKSAAIMEQDLPLLKLKKKGKGVVAIVLYKISTTLPLKEKTKMYFKITNNYALGYLGLSKK